MKIWQREITLALLVERSQRSLVDHLGIEFLEIGDDYLTARMPVDHRTRQPFGIMHGGASCTLAETVGSMAAHFCVDIEKNYCVGLDINTNHIRAIKAGDVFAKASPYHLGKSTQVWAIEIKDQTNQLISVTRLTMAVLKKR